MELNAEVITGNNYQAFINESEFAVVLVDTGWDVRGMAKIQPTFRKAIKEYAGAVSFAQFDPEIEVNLANHFNIRNMPTVLYFRNGELVAALVSASQNISGRVKALIQNEGIGYHDGHDSI